MQISRYSAMQIVTEISNIIGQHVNMMDCKGYIIASTNSERIGTLHEGAKTVIDELLSELVIYSDEEYAGSKRGINLPLMFEEKCVGVIGITGEREQVEKYGQIIKKMTEILMLDTYVKEQKLLDQRLKKRFIEEWLFAETNSINQELIERGLMLGVDITLPRRIMIATPIIMETDGEGNKIEHVINQVEKSVKKIVLQHNNDNVFIRIGSKMIAIISQQGDDRLRQLAKQLVTTTFKCYGLKLAVGVDNNLGNYKIIHTSYINAEKALKACLASSQHEIKFYEDINLEIFMGEIPKHLKEEFIKKIFRDCTLEEVENFIPILKVLFEVNGSIKCACERLFMHKNTLQYKLKKIAEKTHHDPRNLNNAALFYIAIYFFCDMRDVD